MDITEFASELGMASTSISLRVEDTYDYSISGTVRAGCVRLVTGYTQFCSNEVPHPVPDKGITEVMVLVDPTAVRTTTWGEVKRAWR